MNVWGEEYKELCRICQQRMLWLKMIEGDIFLAVIRGYYGQRSITRHPNILLSPCHILNIYVAQVWLPLTQLYGFRHIGVSILAYTSSVRSILPDGKVLPSGIFLILSSMCDKNWNAVFHRSGCCLKWEINSLAQIDESGCACNKVQISPLAVISKYMVLFSSMIGCIND